MKTIRLFLILLIFGSLYSCSIIKLQKHGYISSESFHYKSDFSTIKTLIVLPVEINGHKKNFLFDTGADVTLIQSDTTRGKVKKIDGASNQNMKLGNEIIKSFKIGDVEFIETYALNGNLVGLKEQVPNFGGLIGQSIISKANWLIDYPNKKIEMSNKQLIDSTYTNIKVNKKDGAPYITLTIDGVKYKALIDLGSSSALTIPEDSKLAEKIISKYDFKENDREVYTIGGLKKSKEKIGHIPTINLDGIEFKNIETKIRHTSQLRIGNDFFKDYIIYIDNLNSRYSIKKNN